MPDHVTGDHVEVERETGEDAQERLGVPPVPYNSAWWRSDVLACLEHARADVPRHQ
jgi:hypothetical protein